MAKASARASICIIRCRTGSVSAGVRNIGLGPFVSSLSRQDRRVSHPAAREVAAVSSFSRLWVRPSCPARSVRGRVLRGFVREWLSPAGGAVISTRPGIGSSPELVPVASRAHHLLHDIAHAARSSVELGDVARYADHFHGGIGRANRHAHVRHGLQIGHVVAHIHDLVGLHAPDVAQLVPTP